MQTPDTKPGNYYVTAAKQGGRIFPMLGPFTDDHAAALARVDDVARFIRESGQDPFAEVATGTCRLAIDTPGKLNDALAVA